MTPFDAASRRTTFMTCRAGAAAIAAMAVALLSLPAFAQAGSFEPDFRDLTLGVPATEMSIEGYDAISCGSNGGPPLRALANWAQYDQCRPDREGFYEVAAEFGLVERITAERLAAMYNGQVDYSRGGTRFDQFPVVLSVLFDEDGISRGIRIVTDQRAPVGDRARAHLLPLQIIPRYAARGGA